MEFTAVRQDCTMIIDFRIRPPFKEFLSMGPFDVRASGFDPQYPGQMYGYIPPRSVTTRALSVFMDEMDAAGIDYAVVCGRASTSSSSFSKGYVGPDVLYELVNLYKGRLFGVAALDALDPMAPKIAERSVRELGMRGISIEPGWCSEPCYCDDPRLEPIYETAESLGIFVMITMSYLIGSDLSYSDPMRLEHVVSRHKGTAFLVPHACWPHYSSMAAVSFKYPNLYWVPDFFFYLPFMPSVDVMPAFNTALKRQVLFASSYPVRGLEEAVRLWKEKAWDEEALQLSLYGNAARLLKF